eukprot:COSAG02_NODE_5231_length_4520_cov_70.095454_1_plen_69_part_00
MFKRRCVLVDMRAHMGMTTRRLEDYGLRRLRLYGVRVHGAAADRTIGTFTRIGYDFYVVAYHSSAALG